MCCLLDRTKIVDGNPRLMSADTVYKFAALKRLQLRCFLGHPLQCGRPPAQCDWFVRYSCGRSWKNSYFLDCTMLCNMIFPLTPTKLPVVNKSHTDRNSERIALESTCHQIPIHSEPCNHDSYKVF